MGEVKAANLFLKSAKWFFKIKRSIDSEIKNSYVFLKISEELASKCLFHPYLYIGFWLLL